MVSRSIWWNCEVGETMKTIILKLINGEEIIGGYDGSSSCITNPLIIGLVPVGQNQVTIRLVPFSQFTNDEQISFTVEHILASYTPSGPVAKQYEETLKEISLQKSGITLAKPGDLDKLKNNRGK